VAAKRQQRRATPVGTQNEEKDCMTNRIIDGITRIAGTIVLVGFGFAGTVDAADGPSPVNCAIAAEYDRQADAFEAGAERYRAWAAAAGVLTENQTANEWAFTRQANSLDAAAKQSRGRAAEARRSATPATTSAIGDCNVPSRS
jgi:hypothetical protein